MNLRIGQLCIAVGALALTLSSCQNQKTPDTEPQGPAVTGPQQPPVKGGTQTGADKGKPQYQPVQVGPYVPQAPGKRVSRVSVPGAYVALTFDDGPSAANTPRILNILKAHGAHATFFVAGENAARNQGLLSRAASEGHEIGSHTYSHINLNKSSDAKIDSEMTRTNSIITAATGRRPRVMRPPYGATNARIVDKMYNDYGMTSVLWDVDTLDWKHPGVSIVINRAVSNARPGSIILVHDIHASTADAIEGIVTGLQARGFKLVTVSELLALAGKGSAPAPAATPAPAPEAPAESAPAEAAEVPAS